MSKVRLNKFLADSGLCSRRQADEHIDEGRVQINGRKVFELGIKVDPETDVVKFKNKIVRAEQKLRYFVLNKPKQVLTSMSDPEGRPTVGDMIPKKIKERLFPVGRLDWDSEGLLLLTNDGDFAQKITHPKNAIQKKYWVKVDGQLGAGQLKKLTTGVTIPGGKAKAIMAGPLRRTTASKHMWIEMIITEGRNRQIRKMIEKVGGDVLKLQRVSIGRLRLGKIKKGVLKELTYKEAQKALVPGTF